jgi:hypothetical protein
MTVDIADMDLLRAWKSFYGDFTDEFFAEIEALLPTLVAARYVEAQEDRWGFTPKGIARAEAPERAEHGMIYVELSRAAESPSATVRARASARAAPTSCSLIPWAKVSCNVSLNSSSNWLIKFVSRVPYSSCR